jgi:hypothetical protein
MTRKPLRGERSPIYFIDDAPFLPAKVDLSDNLPPINDTRQVNAAGADALMSALEHTDPSEDATFVYHNEEIPMTKPFRYWPDTGNIIPASNHQQTAQEYRDREGRLAWLYDPWTGRTRDPRDIGSDPFGYLVVPSDPIGGVEQQQQPHVENLVKSLVNRFLAWPLPKTVASDGCVTNADYQFPRSGTNLLSATEATEMIEYLLMNTGIEYLLMNTGLLGAPQVEVDSWRPEYEQALDAALDAYLDTLPAGTADMAEVREALKKHYLNRFDNLELQPTEATMKVRESLTVMAIYADIMANIKNSIGRKQIQIGLDENDPAPERTIEEVTKELAAAGQEYFPKGENAPTGLQDWLTKAGFSFTLEGHPKVTPEVLLLAMLPDDLTPEQKKDLVEKVFTGPGVGVGADADCFKRIARAFGWTEGNSDGVH